MIGYLIRIFGNSVAIYAAYIFVPGFIVVGGIKEYFLAGAMLGLLNGIVKPPIKLLAMPFIILTLGILLIVINAFMLWLVDYVFHFVIIESIAALILATIIVAIVNAIIAAFSKIID